MMALLLFTPMFLLAAKCIDNESMYQDNLGDWHVVGEMRNDTDVWGANMMLGGSLMDDAGNVLATGQAPACPFELAAHGTSVFDVQFFQSYGLHPTKYEVHPMSGRSLDQPLQPLQVSLSGFAAKRTSSGVTITGTIRARRAYSQQFGGCTAFYNSAGKVVRQITIFGFGKLSANADQPLTLPLPDIPGDATAVAFWLVESSDADPLSSDYGAAVTGKLTIR
ncbi:MAG: hypothetical protein EPO22_01535 [Dehalococcoidia bacterium]|nr:MAG: hypothetical protein EPO22_01535 [Dehalococcoidia bacterium]